MMYKTFFRFAEVITSLKSNFEQSVIDGNLQCEVVSAPIPEPVQPQPQQQGQQGQHRPRPPGLAPWITERFGHMCCYYGTIINFLKRAIYNIAS